MKIDLHTHSEASHDGGITPDEYAQMLKDELLDCVAITDHNRIDFARGMQKALGSENIIVGEEISTSQGEIIGLFLVEEIPAGMTVQETIDAIRAQAGLVYIPHPFETVRKGISEELLQAVAQDVDIIEAYNGRAFFQNTTKQALQWSKTNQVVTAASSDAHNKKGLGYTFTNINNLPTRENLVAELASSTPTVNRPPFYTLFYPKLNRLKNFIKGQT